MKIKGYQQSVMRDLSAFMEAIDETEDLNKAWRLYWDRKDVPIGFGGVPAYQNKIPGVPHVCMKVPTGGGKTFMACSSVKRIFDHLPADKPKLLIWLVPSDAILSQTIRVLSDPKHDYRQKLDSDFAGKVEVYTKDMLLNGQNFTPDTVRETLSVCVLSYASLRIDSKKKDVRKVYQENGNLFRFAEFFENKDLLLADTPDTALIQVLRNLSPVVVVDESHNAGSNLSVEMLNNLNPSFVLELTATPRQTSNILSYVDARELKKENMVKLPVVVFNRNNRQTVINDAVQLRGNIEQQAKAEEAAGGEYIRPIVLFQAQPNINEDSETFDKIKDMLTGMGIPEEQIGVKTSKVDDISGMDLMSPSSEIRYIITVNALKEGWDCPFAYILASLANKTSRVDVEQILGRILRQPYAKEHKSALLNTSYVLTCSNDFHDTLENIVSALNKSGFSRKDYRVAEEMPVSEEAAPEIQAVQQTIDCDTEAAHEETNENNNAQEEVTDSFDDINTEELRESYAHMNDDEGGQTGNLTQMIQIATVQSEQYNEEVNENADNPFVGGELGEMLQQNAIQQQYREEVKDLRIPQFYIKTDQHDFFSGGYDVLHPENLSEGFTLSGQDAQVNFELATGEVYRVDIQAEGEAVPKYKKATKSESEFIRQYLERFPKEKRIKQCAKLIAGQINKNNRYATKDVEDYVQRVVQNMTEDEISLMETSIQIYAKKIQKRIDTLEEAYRLKQFKKWLDSGRIICRDSYKPSDVITPAQTTDSIPYSLYEAEKDDLNNFERQVIDTVVGTENIRWWHRIIEKKDFCLNGYFNHYPDFMVMTKSGKLLLIEAKGDYLDGDDSKSKLELGRKWQEQAGQLYRYFMVFKDKQLGMDGAYTLDEFSDVMKDI